MSFVPVTGPAVFTAADTPRDSVVEFTDGRHTVTLPIRGALPVLTRAPTRDEAHPSVRLIAGAALLGMRLVAAGSFEPVEGRWRPAPSPADDDQARLLAGDDADAVRLVHDVVAAVVDALPRSAPSPSRVARGSSRTPFHERLERRLRRHDPDARREEEADLAQLVRISLRIEADEEELVAGSVRVVPQAHDEQDPMRVCDAALLWTGEGADHGFGSRARTHAGIAMRAAADAWPVLDRLLELRVPDQIVLDSDELVSLLDEGVAALGARGIDVMWPRSLGRDLTATAVLDRRPSSGAAVREEPLQTGVLTEEALFAFNWQLALHGDPLTPEEMDDLARAASPILRLRGQWAVVDPGLARKARKRLIRTATPAQAVAAALTGVAEVDEGADGGAAEVIVGASLLRVREQLVSAATREPVEPPVALAATLRDYQRHGLTWLDQLTSLGLGACLADDMGLGKTVTLIALALHRTAREGGSGPTLVVCPASLLGNWQAEVERFAPGVPVRRFHGSRRDLSGLDPAAASFVLTTYGTMRRDHEALAEVGWDLVVADEAQHVKNARSATARTLRRIPSRARVALTGTPVENDLTELWSILDWATPGLLGSRNAFRRVWAAPIESGVDPAVTARFRELVSPFLLRRRKSDPGIAPELPPRTDTDHLLALTREQVVLYEAYVRDCLERIERSDEAQRRGLVLAMLTGLKQICNHPSHFLKQGALRRSSEKIDLLDEIVGTVLAEDGAVLVFTQYVAMARLLADHLARQGVPHQLLHGGTPVAERERMVSSFQAGPEAGGVPVFLLSLKAGGTGLNLTRADHVVHFDRWWNPAVEEQASDRAHRIGQTRSVQVHRMITTGTIEERIAELLARKRSIADAVLVSGESALTELSDSELRDLVTLRRDRSALQEKRPVMATHARLAPRPAGAARARTWWGKAWVRAVEEAAYAEEDLRRGRRLARGGRVGGITVEPGRFLAAVEEGDDVLTVSGGLPELEPPLAAALAEVVAGESGRVAALLAGDLPHTLVEHAEQAGVELLPFGGELATRCTCEPWADPCHHALAVLQQLTWLIEADPFVLIALRGIGRDDLLSRVHALSAAPDPSDGAATDLDVAADAARRAARLLELLDDPDASLDHLW